MIEAVAGLDEVIMSLAGPFGEDGEEAVTAADCRAALRFANLVASECPSVPPPAPAPSVLGGVSLCWMNDDRHLQARICYAHSGGVLYQETGPGGHVEFGDEPWEDAVKRVAALFAEGSSDA